MTAATRSNVRHALRVAAIATAVLAAVYVAAVGIFDVAVSHRLNAQVDARLTAALDEARDYLVNEPKGADRAPPGVNDSDDAPLYVWRVGSDHTVVSASIGAPLLPRRSWSPTGRPTTAPIASSTFRLRAIGFDGGWLVAGISVAYQRHDRTLLVEVELVAAPVVLLGMFLGALVIGVKASAPVEQARRRQLEFTSDASHELRTPLSVIEAEVDVALARDRPAADYRETLGRVRDESGRLRRIVENLLWLGRLDATPAPASAPIDLAVIAEQCVLRFAALASARHIDLRFAQRGTADPLISAPPEWADRLAGVLVDNACRYTPEGGTVQVLVEARGGRVVLAVEDSGPGIAPAERPRLFDRFHRASQEPGGTGLGLAIGDAVVRATGGQWQVGDSFLGGARMAVSWPRPHRGAGAEPGTPLPPPVTTGDR